MVDDLIRVGVDNDFIDGVIGFAVARGAVSPGYVETVCRDWIEEREAGFFLRQEGADVG